MMLATLTPDLARAKRGPLSPGERGQLHLLKQMLIRARDRQRLRHIFHV